MRDPAFCSSPAKARPPQSYDIADPYSTNENCVLSSPYPPTRLSCVLVVFPYSLDRLLSLVSFIH